MKPADVIRRRADASEAWAQALPWGASFESGGLAGASRYNVEQHAIRALREAADEIERMGPDPEIERLRSDLAEARAAVGDEVLGLRASMAAQAVLLSESAAGYQRRAEQAEAEVEQLRRAALAAIREAWRSGYLAALADADDRGDFGHSLANLYEEADGCEVPEHFLQAQEKP